LLVFVLVLQSLFCFVVIGLGHASGYVTDLNVDVRMLLVQESWEFADGLFIVVCNTMFMKHEANLCTGSMCKTQSLVFWLLGLSLRFFHPTVVTVALMEVFLMIRAKALHPA